MNTQTETVFSHAKLDTENLEKEFLKEQLQLTGMEVSYTEILPGEANRFIHSHQQNEELYICVHGQGQMQVDGHYMDFSQGSFVRVAPSGKRAIRNIGEEPLRYLCVQARVNSLSQWTREDGILHDEELVWPTA